MLQDLQAYKDKHIEHKKMFTANSTQLSASLLPAINSPHLHEITARVCVQGILTQLCNIPNLKDTRQPHCHGSFYHGVARVAADDCQQKAIISMCAMLEIDVQNHILHPV